MPRSHGTGSAAAIAGVARGALRMGCDVTNFGLSEMLRCSRAVHQAASNAPTLEASARRICRVLYDVLETPDGDRACALVRCYKTHSYGDLPPDVQRVAWRMLDDVTPPPSRMKCLTLLGTAGDEPAWNARRSSRGHQAIPLPSSQIVERAPMIAGLIKEFGVDLNDVVNPTPDVVRDLAGKTYGVFHVEDARGSPTIPVQDEFVAKYGIRSVVGFGGSLASGDLFAVIFFARVPVSASSADRFRAIALDVKTLFFLYNDTQVFDAEGGIDLRRAEERGGGETTAQL